MSITDWPINERPREKLLNLGPQALSEAELLAIFLRTGVKGKTAVDLARDLLKEYNGLRGLLNSSHSRFCQSHGLGSAKYAQLQAVLEMSRRYFQENLQKTEHITNSDEAKYYFMSRLQHHQREVFACLFLDTQHRMLAFEELFWGTVDSASVYPRELVKRTLHHNASAVILAHNHPSGTLKPSAEDKDITELITRVLSFIDVRVLDHMIVGRGTVTSFSDLGLM